MPGSLGLHVEEAFAAETHRLLARRIPLGVGFFVALVAVAGLIEWTYYPGRLRPLVVSFSAEMALCAGAVVASRMPGLRSWIVPIACATSIGVALCVTLYVLFAGASGDALAFVVIIFLPGIALLFPWGAAGQVPLVVGTIAIYLLALWLGVPRGLPLPYGIFAAGGSAVASIVGAVFLDRYRRAIFRQRVLLERARDEQLAMLYDVTRTVTATLELREVLERVCRSVLGGHALEPLWLFWRETPDGDVRGLAAERAGEAVVVRELADDPSRWATLVPAAAGAALRAPTPDEAATLETDRPPALVLHLPLAHREELVGAILADPGLARRPASFLDVAATLGNTAAMAIANARLHALLLHHRGELQRLSNKGLVVVEDILRRISRELHDNTCQALMAIKLDLALIERRFAGQAGGLHGAVEDLRAQVIEVMHGIRQMSHLIYPPVLDDFGAVVAIESVAAKYQEASTLAVRVECSEPSMRFAPPVELLLFRVFQEALTNVVKHAAARAVIVRLGLEDGGVRLEIEDDGRGFDAHGYFRSPPASAGLGVLGMRERVGHLGGVFRVTSRPGRGTHITVRVPAAPLPAAKAAG